METNILSLIIFAPLAGAAINWFIGRRVRDERFIGVVACGSVAISAIVAVVLVSRATGEPGSGPSGGVGAGWSPHVPPASMATRAIGSVARKACRFVIGTSSTSIA